MAKVEALINNERGNITLKLFDLVGESEIRIGSESEVWGGIEKYFSRYKTSGSEDEVRFFGASARTCDGDLRETHNLKTIVEDKIYEECEKHNNEIK